MQETIKAFNIRGVYTKIRSPKASHFHDMDVRTMMISHKQYTKLEHIQMLLDKFLREIVLPCNFIVLIVVISEVDFAEYPSYSLLGCSFWRHHIVKMHSFQLLLQP